MKHRAFKINENRLLEEYPQAELESLASMNDVPLWIDISRRDPEVLAKFLHSLELHPLAIEACLELMPNSRIGAYGKSLFIGLPMLTHWGDRNRTFLSILCLPGRLITVHEGDIPPLDSIMTQFTSTMQFHTLSTSAVLYQILDHIIDQDMILALGARDRIDHFEEALDQETDSEWSKETRSVKRQVVLLEAILEDQHHCVSTLQTVESESFSIDNLQDHFRDAMAHLEHAVRSVGRQADRLTAMHQHYLLKLQDKTNKRLQILTIVSAIFLPLMLVTGIYGMNFRYMPELSWRYGYFIVLVLMCFIATGLLWFLSRKGWFK